jgi:hypothetical protein
MSDDQVMRFLMAIAAYVAELHARPKEKKSTNAGSHYDDDSIPAEEEGFARWMGWRGEDEQEREINKKRGK